MESTLERRTKHQEQRNGIVLTSPDVSILIVCYRSLSYIGDCLRSIYERTHGCEFEVLLLDCSNDGTIPYVEQQFPQVKIIANTENLGFACGNNFLVQHAEGNWLCLLNADTYLLDDAISQLHRSSKSIENLGAIGGRARRPSGVRDPGSRQFFPSLVRLSIVALGGARYLNGALPENARAAGEVETLSGAFMMVPKKVWAEMGGLDEGFFAYAEEMDLCYRIRSKGYRICMDPKAELVHLGVGGAPRAETTVMKTKSMMRFIRKHWGKARSQAACWVIWLHGVVRLVSGMELRFMSPRKGKELVAAFQPIVINPSLWRDG